jgi:hypothetical protein
VYDGVVDAAGLVGENLAVAQFQRRRFVGCCGVTEPDLPPALNRWHIANADRESTLVA